MKMKTFMILNMIVCKGGHINSPDWWIDNLYLSNKIKSAGYGFTQIINLSV